VNHNKGERQICFKLLRRDNVRATCFGVITITALVAVQLGPPALESFKAYLGIGNSCVKAVITYETFQVSGTVEHAFSRYRRMGKTPYGSALHVKEV
jgi:hypothetical protein